MRRRPSSIPTSRSRPDHGHRDVLADNELEPREHASRMPDPPGHQREEEREARDEGDQNEAADARVQQHEEPQPGAGETVDAPHDRLQAELAPVRRARANHGGNGYHAF